MELLKFKIVNYKSIKDSTECYLNPTLTIFAGMNESGKSSILEALRDFNPNNNIEEDSVRIDGNGDPEISLWFQLSEDDIFGIWQKLGMPEDFDQESHAFLLENPLKITKKFDDKYYLDESFISLIKSRFKKDYKAYFTTISKKIASLKAMEVLSAFDFSSLNKETSIQPLNELLLKIEKTIKPTKTVKVTNADGTTSTKVVPEEVSIEQELINNIQQLIDEINEAKPSLGGYYHEGDFIDDFTNTATSIIPEIIFFSSFEDILEFEFPIEELESKKINVDLCNIAEVDIEKVKKFDNFQNRANYLSGKSASVSTKFKNDWLQDEINILFKTEDKVIQFGIQEEKDTSFYRAEQRSKGFQWFLSFYIRLNAQDAVNKIILVDEPGLYLHAKAQEDVLKVFESMANENTDSKVVISTHSPYLIDLDHLDRVLLVEKDKVKGTKVFKSHSQSKHETITPILTKMGFDISKSALVKNKNILLEGISDYYYLNAFRTILQQDKIFANVAFIPCVGATKIPQLASLCIGWGLEYVALFDNDKAGREVSKVMSKELGEFDNSVFICTEEDCSIEDLFTKSDFNNFVLSNINLQNEDDSLTNVAFLKKSKVDKVLLSKLFYDSIKNSKIKISLSKKTKDSFLNLYNVLAKKLNLKTDVAKVKGAKSAK